jgi:hypothetical protein
MQAVHGESAAFEPHDPLAYGVVVDSRLRRRLGELQQHRVVHLVRDGRDVVRSLYAWHVRAGRRVETLFEYCCREWADAVDVMRPYPAIRLEDLTQRADPTIHHPLPDWRSWDIQQRAMFESYCGRAMRRHGYA